MTMNTTVTQLNFTVFTMPEISEIPSAVKIMNILGIIISIIILVFELVAMVILSKLKRFPIQIKILLINLLLSSVLFLINIIVSNAILLAMSGEYSNVIFYVGASFGGVFRTLSCSSVAGLTVERYLALHKSMKYASMISRRNIALAVCAIWTVNCVFPLAVFITTIHMQCHWSLDTCDIHEIVQPLTVTLTVLLSFYHVFIAIEYIRISRLVKQHLKSVSTKHNITGVHEPVLSNGTNMEKKRSTQKEKRDFKVTKAIVSIVTSYILLHIPIFIHLLIYFVFVPAQQTIVWRTVLQASIYFFTNLNSLVNLYLYTWKLEECKMVFLNMFMSWNKKCREEAERIRLTVFDIVTAERRPQNFRRRHSSVIEYVLLSNGHSQNSNRKHSSMKENTGEGKSQQSNRRNSCI